MFMCAQLKTGVQYPTIPPRQFQAGSTKTIDSVVSPGYKDTRDNPGLLQTLTRLMCLFRFSRFGMKVTPQ